MHVHCIEFMPFYHPRYCRIFFDRNRLVKRDIHCLYFLPLISCRRCQFLFEKINLTVQFTSTAFNLCPFHLPCRCRIFLKKNRPVKTGHPLLIFLAVDPLPPLPVVIWKNKSSCTIPRPLHIIHIVLPSLPLPEFFQRKSVCATGHPLHIVHAVVSPCRCRIFFLK